MTDAADRALIPPPPARSWPFLLRQRELAEARAFIDREETAAPRLLRIFGDSGSGKSFLAKEIIAELAHRYSEGAIFHINVAPADLEASDFLGQVHGVLRSPGTADQTSAGVVSTSISRRWRRQSRGQPHGRREYFYNVLRELSGQIPLVGPFVKACLPPKLPVAEAEGPEPVRALRFLLRVSHSHPVLMVIDNIQFLPSPVRDILEAEMPLAGRQFTLVTIERLRGDRGLFWMPPIDGLAKHDIHLGQVTVQDVELLVREQLPEEEHVAEIAEAIHRRSGGNLKSVWFQTKFVASRRASQEPLLDDVSYEAVVQSLTPVDQLVLRVVVVLLGGLSICQMLGVIKAMNLHVAGEAVGAAIADLSALGLLVVNSKHHDRVRVEHEIVSQVVSQLIPEEEKLELQSQLVHALPALLERSGGLGDSDALTLYDRLIGIATERDVRSSALIQSHIVRFIEASETAESYTYLCTLLRDSVCWDALDILPALTVRTLLNAAQKCSAFETGLLATQKLQTKGVHLPLARLFEAKFLVQLFRYDEALQALAAAPPSPERQCIEFNILINLCEDQSAAELARSALESASSANPSEYQLVVLRNSGHLFHAAEARRHLEAAVTGFEKIGRRFGAATATNNLALVEISAGNISLARQHLGVARGILAEMGSCEVYQPLVNLSGLEAAEGRWARAERFLVSARQAAPRSLPMDNLLFEYNHAALAHLRGRKSVQSLFECVTGLHADARRTRDRRFIELLGWFAAQLADKLGAQPPSYSEEIIGRMRSRSYVGTELFIKARSTVGDIEVPYMLSPHWRY